MLLCFARSLPIRRSRYSGDGVVLPCNTGVPCHAQLGAEIQKVNIFGQFAGTFTTGTFKLAYNGVKSTCLTVGATSGQVTTALQSIPALNAAGVRAYPGRWLHAVLVVDRRHTCVEACLL